MDKIKTFGLNFVSFLKDKTLKVKLIKLSVVLLGCFLTFLNRDFGYLTAGVIAIYVAFEFSADSLSWLIIVGIMVPYIKVVCLYILMCELIVILMIYLVQDIRSKAINCKNWRFITLVSLLFVIALLLLLPLAKSYRFASQVKRLSLFTVLLLGVFYVRQINIKNLLIMFSIAVASLCGLFMLAKLCGGGNDTIIKEAYSKGLVERFSALNMDPNFTGAILICAITSWFILYRKNWINKCLYFGGLFILGIFAIMTVSKATYIIIGLLGMFAIVENIVITIKTKNYKHLIELLWYLIVIVLAGVICWKYVDCMYNRLFNPERGWWSNENNDGVMANLTTGRTDLWIGYLKVIFSSWQIALFGAGVNADYAVPGCSAHSMPITYMYKYGLLIVIALLAIFFISALPYIKKSKPYNFVPVILITAIFCSLGEINVKYIYIFVITFLTLCCNGIEYEKSNDLNITREPDIKAKEENFSTKQL